MTTLNEAKEAIYLRFTSNFTGVAADRIALDNEEFNTPTSGDWVRLVIRNISRTQNTLGKPGNRRFRSKALVLVQVYTEVNTGVKQSDALAKEAADKAAAEKEAAEKAAAKKKKPSRKPRTD